MHEDEAQGIDFALERFERSGQSCHGARHAPEDRGEEQQELCSRKIGKTAITYVIARHSFAIEVQIDL